MKKKEKNESVNEALQRELEEMKDTLEAIRTGQVDAVVVNDGVQHKLYTLESADRAYRVFIEHMSEGAVILHHDGTIEYANAQFGALIQRTQPDIFGELFSLFLMPESAESFSLMMQQCIVDSECRGEIQLRAGKYGIPALVSLSLLKQGDEFRFAMIVTDLQRQKKVQLQLEERNRALISSNYDLQQFASVASHDLQEPLRKISTFANFIFDGYRESMPEKMHTYLGKIATSAARMQRLIIDVLNFSKLSENAAVYELCDLNVIIDQLLEDFELLIEQKKARIEVDKLPSLYVQPVQLGQALRNILSNALKFTYKNRDPYIRISATMVAGESFDSAEQPNGPFCILRIRDNGIGFDEAYLHKIFGLFQRLHSTDAFEGTGIGLAITKKIIEQHHGFIEASAKENEGAEFRILLPVERP